MKPGNWLQPRYPAREVFEKDYAKLDIVKAPEVWCPGCKKVCRLTRRTPDGSRIGGWCKHCDRGVMT
jgi:hypothetical protein